MTDRPAPSGRPLQPWLDNLAKDRLHALLDHAGAGLFNARRAAQCLTDPATPRHETTAQLLAYLSEAIRELHAARVIVVAQLEGSEDAGGE